MKLRRLTALLGALALTFSATSAVLATKAGDTGHKVTICHATSSEKHPYVIITVDIASAGYGGNKGHAGHGRDGVWYPGAKAARFDWGDIIPAYDHNTFHYDGLNLDNGGAAILENGCKKVTEGGQEDDHHPDIHIVKTASPETLPAGGGSVTYTYKVTTGEGDVPLTDVSVTDAKCSPINYVKGDTSTDDVLDLDETWTFTCTKTITENTTNTGIATGYDGETKVTDEDDATVTVAPHAPAINIVKTASPVTLSPGGGPVTYTFVVTNAGNVALTNVTVSDNKCAPVTFVSGDTNHDAKLDLTESWTFTCSATITEDTTNIGTATGHDGDTTVTDTDDATVTIVQVNPQGNTPDIHLEKTAAPLTLPAEGGKVTYTYVVSNTGSEPLTNVSVRDDNGTPGNTADDFDVDCPKTTLAIDESMTCTADVTGTTKTTTNIATTSGTAGETTVTDTDDATVTVGSEGAVQGETNVPTAPQTDIGATGDAGSSLPVLLLVLGIIGLGAVFLTPARARRR